MQKFVVMMIGVMMFCLISACTQHKVEVAPVEIKPIHITIDVNVKIDKALDDFFGILMKQPKVLKINLHRTSRQKTRRHIHET